MGCWNATCQISQLPILHDTPIRFVLLKQSNRYSRGCYATDFWDPCLVPLRGVYDDYGSIEKIEECFNFEMWKSIIASSLVELPQGENAYRHPPVKRTDSFSDFLKNLREERVYFNVGLSKQALVLPTMIREDVYQYILSIIPFKGYSVKEFSEQCATTLSLIDSMEALKGQSDKPIDKMAFLLTHKSNSITKDLFKYDSFLDKMYMDKKLKEPDPVFMKEIVDFLNVRYFVNHLRITWHPQTGDGSQSAEFELAKKFHKGIAAIADTELKKLD